MRGSGLELLVETARGLGVAWSDTDRAGAAHLYGVIGPDQYHEPVDDNTFTNVLARWNRRNRGPWSEGAGQIEVSDEERSLMARWVADVLVDAVDYYGNRRVLGDSCPGSPMRLRNLTWP